MQIDRLLALHERCFKQPLSIWTEVPSSMVQLVAAGSGEEHRPVFLQKMCVPPCAFSQRLGVKIYECFKDLANHLLEYFCCWGLPPSVGHGDLSE